jgi:hypothetical protein
MCRCRNTQFNATRSFKQKTFLMYALPLPELNAEICLTLPLAKPTDHHVVKLIMIITRR